ncbi:hypothetical protein [Kosmotoga pacifica]|uniref:Uncharacterized protein n=1 Tax=Kosmotoga pacifica TaxID=1330330 RepID=A0A0G2ZCN2_9BACT|nr:hypothetical protein [Kosmotoga pacifica]AKI97304.1 hypothetical protein IX53_05155 [Kosmotoga pacifica]
MLIGLFVASVSILGFVEISYLEVSVEKQLIDSLHLFLDTRSFTRLPNVPTRCIITEEERDLELGKGSIAKVIEATVTSGNINLKIEFIDNIIPQSNSKKGGSKK